MYLPVKKIDFFKLNDWLNKDSGLSILYTLSHPQLHNVFKDQKKIYVNIKKKKQTRYHK